MKKILVLVRSLISELKRYKPEKIKVGTCIGLWLLWVCIAHYAWLGAWYLFPISLILLLPSLYWFMVHLAEASYLEVLSSVKQFFELTAAQVGSGYSIQNSIEKAIDEGLQTKRFHPTLFPIFEEMRLNILIGHFGENFFSQMVDHSKIQGIKTLEELIQLCIKTGSPLDQLMIYYSQMLSDQLKHREHFKAKLSQKRNEFQIMMFMPIGGVIGIRGMLPEFYGTISSGLSGVVFLSIITLVYSASCHLFYYNEHKFSKFMDQL